MNDVTGRAYVIDDDISVRESVSGLLHSRGISVTCYESAAQYLESAHPSAACCLVLDLRMPGISGLELQRQLMEEGAPPIIFMSGRGDVPSAVQAMKAGAVEFLTKPVQPDVLVTAVRKALERDQLLRARKAQMDELRARFAQLSPRQREVLPLLVKGLLNKQSAAELGIAEVTLQIHRTQIMKKMAARSFAELVHIASKLGIPSVGEAR